VLFSPRPSLNPNVSKNPSCLLDLVAQSFVIQAVTYLGGYATTFTPRSAQQSAAQSLPDF
jgi:hypothetical protein